VVFSASIRAWAVIALLTPLISLAADQSKSVDRQLDAAKRQRESIQARQTKDQFFKTPWLREDTAFQPAQAAPAPECEKLSGEVLDSMVAKHLQDGISATLVRAIIDQESGGLPCAVSSKGAMGLMQIMPELASEMNVEDPFDPDQNLQAGIKYLVTLTARYPGDLPRTLAAYNAGPGRVDSANGIPEIAETQQYVKSIMAKLDRK
jgi:soluble lytic murein transglycosylase-like protein